MTPRRWPGGARARRIGEVAGHAQLEAALPVRDGITLAQTGSSPSRPSPGRSGSPAPAFSASPTVRTFLGAPYLEAVPWATRQGLKVAWLERGRRLQFFNETTRLVIEADRREVEGGLEVEPEGQGAVVHVRISQFYVTTT